MATYYAQHREACLAYQKKYDDLHKEDRAVYTYNYYTDNQARLVEEKRAYNSNPAVKARRAAHDKEYRERKKAQAAK